MAMGNIELMVTLWPSFPHFAKFAGDGRLSGIRLNSAMTSAAELDAEFEMASKAPACAPLWFDIKGRQLRVVEAIRFPDHLEIVINHPISVHTPVPVLFKAGANSAPLVAVEDSGSRLVFHGGPKLEVRPGESLCIRDSSLVVHGPFLAESEHEKIEKVKAAGIRKWFLSYVEEQSDVDRFLELVGADAEVMLKIESPKGLRYVDSDFRKRPNLALVAARGDLYVEIARPHLMMAAMRLIIGKDPEALAGSRLLLSILNGPVPECVDFMELAWLADAGYRRFMLCDEICLKGELLANAVNAFDEFRTDYEPPKRG